MVEQENEAILSCRLRNTSVPWCDGDANTHFWIVFVTQPCTVWEVLCHENINVMSLKLQ